MNKEYKMCSVCVMDTTDKFITFDDNGVCNHCKQYKQIKDTLINDSCEKEKELQKIIDKIKKSGENRRYDCIVGISGGVDSSYVAYLAKQWELRALLVHLDNGWNSELAVKNVENIVKYTGFELYTLVIDWEEFKDLQRSFFKADVIDLELLSDHAIFAAVRKLTRKYNIRYLLSGENFETEAILPKSWNWRKSDAANIKSIHKKFGSKKLKTFPFMGTIKKIFYQYTGVSQSISILNYIDYNKQTVMAILKDKMDWKYYGGKHYESIFTRFYQGVILPKKFKIDKRCAHLSTLINSDQIKRDEALLLLKEEPYPKELQEEDFNLVCKKLDFSEDELNFYLNRPEKSHLEYKSDEFIFNLLRRVYHFFNPKKIIN